MVAIFKVNLRNKTDTNFLFIDSQMEEKLAAGDRDGANKAATQSRKWSAAGFGVFFCCCFVAITVVIIVEFVIFDH